MAGFLGNQITAIRQDHMDPRTLEHVTGIPIRSTKGGLLLSYQPSYSTTSSKINGIDWIKNYASLGPKFIEIMKHKLSYGAEIIQFGSQDWIFRKNFSVKEGEKLLQASHCYLYTTAGAIAGLLFVSTDRVAFCSHRSIKTYSTTSKLLKFRYKVSIPLGKINGVRESMNTKRPSNNYVEIATVDDFNFWFMGFINYKKTLRYLQSSIMNPISL